MNREIENAIKEILKPFVYNKYGKTYIGYKETEGALRVEGMILQLRKVLKNMTGVKCDECEKEFDTGESGVNCPFCGKKSFEDGEISGCLSQKAFNKMMSDHAKQELLNQLIKELPKIEADDSDLELGALRYREKIFKLLKSKKL